MGNGLLQLLALCKLENIFSNITASKTPVIQVFLKLSGLLVKTKLIVDLSSLVKSLINTMHKLNFPHIYHSSIIRWLTGYRDKVFKNGPSKIFGKQP